jgi:hypothetical protein
VLLPYPESAGVGQPGTGGTGAGERQDAGTSNRIFTQTYGEENVASGKGVETQLLRLMSRNGNYKVHHERKKARNKTAIPPKPRYIRYSRDIANAGFIALAIDYKLDNSGNFLTGQTEAALAPLSDFPQVLDVKQAIQKSRQPDATSHIYNLVNQEGAAVGVCFL